MIPARNAAPPITPPAIGPAEFLEGGGGSGDVWFGFIAGSTGETGEVTASAFVNSGASDELSQIVYNGLNKG